MLSFKQFIKAHKSIFFSFIIKGRVVKDSFFVYYFRLGYVSLYWVLDSPAGLGHRRGETKEKKITMCFILKELFHP